MNHFFQDQQFVPKASCKLPMDIGFETPTVFGITQQFVVIVGKQTRAESAPIRSIAVNDSAVLGYANLRE